MSHRVTKSMSQSSVFSVQSSEFKLQRCLSLSKAKLGIFYNSSIPHTLSSSVPQFLNFSYP